MEQGHLKNIVQDILEMDLNDEWEVSQDSSDFNFITIYIRVV